MCDNNSISAKLVSDEEDTTQLSSEQSFEMDEEKKQTLRKRQPAVHQIYEEMQQFQRAQAKMGDMSQESWRSYLSDEELDQVLDSRLSAEKKTKMMTKAIKGLLCFVMLLAMSNACTSFVSAMWAKDFKVDLENEAMRTLDGEVVAVQTYADVYEIDEMPIEERRARRTMVLESINEDPSGEHAHRLLRQDREQCSDGSTLCGGKITFDSGVMPEEQFNVIQQKCEMKRTVNIRKKWDDGTTKSMAMCLLDSSITVKPKKNKNKKNRKKNKTQSNAQAFSNRQVGIPSSAQSFVNRMLEDEDDDEDYDDDQDEGRYLKGRKNKQRGRVDDDCNDRQVIISTQGNRITTDCVDCRCYVSGSALMSKAYEPCDTRVGNDDCEAGLICKKEARGPKKGRKDGDEKSDRDVMGTCMSASVSAGLFDIEDTPKAGKKKGKNSEKDDKEDEEDSLNIGVLSAIPKRQGAGLICDPDYGNKACEKGSSCVVESGYSADSGICVEDEEVGSQVKIDATPSIPRLQGKNEECDVSYGDRACIYGFSCVSRGVGFRIGVCLVDMEVTTSVSVDTIIASIPKFQGVDEDCDLTFGNKACVSGFTCVPNGVEVNIGVCTRVAATVLVPELQGEGEVCDLTFGGSACLAGLSCVSSNGSFAANLGFCEVINVQVNSGSSGQSGLIINTRTAPDRNPTWWIDFETHQCVLDCERGRSPNCGGLRPAWDKKEYITAQACCATHLSWKNEEECVPNHRAL